MNPCDRCQEALIVSWTDPRTILITGELMAMTHKSGLYMRLCCLLTYHVGGSNIFDEDTQRAITVDMIGSRSKRHLIHEGGNFEVYKLKQLETQRVRSLTIHRDIKLVDPPSHYEIITETELKQRARADKDDAMDGVVKTHYIYLIRERTAVAADQNVYKIGKTTQDDFKRFKAYLKGFEIFMISRCRDCHRAEREIIRLFKSKYTHEAGYGLEYFRGDPEDMIEDIQDVLRAQRRA